MSVNQRNPTAYGFSQPLIDVSGKTIISLRSPTDRDKAQISTLWINTTDQSVYIITSIVDNEANWELLTNAGGSVTDLIADDMNIAAPLAGVIGILGSANINTTATANAIEVNLNNSVSITGDMEVGGNYSLPNTDGTGTVGVIIFGADRFVSNRGTNNTFVGQDSGNSTLTVGSAVNNAGFGTISLGSLSTGASNCGFGNGTLASATTGSFNFGGGDSVLFNLTTGVNNIAIGHVCASNIDVGSHNLIMGINAGVFYTNESSNICIQNAGAFADANTLRIGTQGAGNLQVNTAYIAGITGSALTANSALVLCGPDGKLGTLTGTDGQIIIGQTGGTPQWGTLVSGGGSVTITYPTANTINLEAAGVAALTGLDGDAGSAAPVGGIIVIAGDGVTTQTSAAADTVTVGLTNGANGQLLIGGGANPIWANLTSTGASVTITNSANGINLEAAGVAALTELTASDLNVATPVAGNINVFGSGILTTTATTNNITVRAATANNGQIPIGNTGTGIPIWTTLTAGSGIAITNAANSITIAATGTEPTRPAFSYTQTSDYAFPASTFMTNTNYFLGATVILAQDFDQGTNVFAGDGAGTAAFFTAPVTGVYSLTMELSAKMSGLSDQCIISQFIITPLKTFSQAMGTRYLYSLTQDNTGALSFSVVAKMNAGQQAFFAYQVQLSGVSVAIANVTIKQNYSLISGYLISQTA